MIINKNNSLANRFIFFFSILICAAISANIYAIKAITPDQVSVQDNTIKFDKIMIQEMIDRAEPLIEEITGRKYKSKIDFRIINREALRLCVIKASLNGLRDWEKGMGEGMNKRRFENSAMKSSQFYIARHFKGNKILYVIPENISHAQNLYSIEDKDIDDFLFLIIAHEMVHAIDNQYYDLVSFLGNTENQDQNLARSAVIGGSASYVTSIIADRLNISKSILRHSLELDICIEDENDPVGKEYYNLYYIKGEELLRGMIDKKGLIEGYNSIFASPPASTRQLIFPEEYFDPPVLSSVEPAKILEKLVDKLPVKEGMPSDLLSLGTVALRVNLISDHINKEEAAEVVKNCLGGVSYLAFQNGFKPDFKSFIKYTLFKKGVNSGVVRVTIINFTDRESATKYDELMKIIQISKQDQSKSDTSYKLIKEEEKHREGFDMVRFSHFEDKRNGNDNSTMNTVGIIDGLYVSVEYTNIKDKTQKDLMDILDLIYTEKSKV